MGWAERRVENKLLADHLESGESVISTSFCVPLGYGPLVQAAHARSGTLAAVTDRSLYLVVPSSKQFLSFPFRLLDAVINLVDVLRIELDGKEEPILWQVSTMRFAEAAQRAYDDYQALANQLWISEMEPDDFLATVREDYRHYMDDLGASLEEAHGREQQSIVQQIFSQGQNKAVVRAALRRAKLVYEELDRKLADQSTTECPHRFCHRRAGHPGPHYESAAWSGR